MGRLTGSCLCGQVALSAQGTPDRVCLCHCRDCRKHHGALFYSAAIFPVRAVIVTGKTHAYKGRHFCPNCGSSVFARTGKEIELHLGALDNADTLKPAYECWTRRRAAWLPEFPATTRHDRDRPE